MNHTVNGLPDTARAHGYRRHLTRRTNRGSRKGARSPSGLEQETGLVTVAIEAS